MAREQYEQGALVLTTDLETSLRPFGVPVEEASTDKSELLECLSKLGKALIAAGSSVGTVENTLTEVANVYQVKCEIIALPNILMVKLDQPPHRIIDVAVQRLTQLKLDQMSELVELIDKLLRKSIHPGMVAEQVDHILAKPHRFNPPTVMLGYLLSCIGLTLQFRPEPLALLITGAAGILVGAMIIWFERWPRFNLLLPVIAAFVVSIWIFNLTRMGVIDGSANLLIAPLIIFLPGALLTTGMIELASMQIISGSARLMYGGAALFLLYIGIAGGLSLSGLPNVYVSAYEAAAFPWWAPFLGTLLFGAGTFIRLSGANRDLIWILLVLYIAMLSQSLGEHWLSPYFGAFLGATLMTLSSEIIARSPQRTPALVSQLLAFWFLVPGARGLLGVTSILGKDFQSAAIGIGETVGLIGAISVGVLLGTLLVSPQKFTPATASTSRLEDRGA
jgi:uncharacterized membrane protein YjjP (DUF1212 family)/uncharacterized membrane protein YjjB (DUF3815 family)